MSYSDFIKTQVKHLRCVICGHSFGAQYDEFIHAFPVFHPSAKDKNTLSCEDVFFKELLRIYRYIHESRQSKTMREIIQDFPWSARIAMQREMIEWCIRQGYFKVDSFKRLQVPPEIEDVCKDLFAELDEDDPEAVQDAVDLIQAALRCFHDDLEKYEENVYSNCLHEDEKKESTLYANLDASDVKLRRHPKGMATAQYSGAREIDQRIRSTQGAMDRRRREARGEN